MTPEQLTELAEKIRNNNATPEEKLQMLKEFNAFVDSLKKEIRNKKNGKSSK